MDFNGSFLGRVRDLVGANPIVLVITKVGTIPYSLLSQTLGTPKNQKTVKTPNTPKTPKSMKLKNPKELAGLKQKGARLTNDLKKEMRCIVIANDISKYPKNWKRVMQMTSKISHNEP